MHAGGAAVVGMAVTNLRVLPPVWSKALLASSGVCGVFGLYGLRGMGFRVEDAAFLGGYGTLAMVTIFSLLSKHRESRLSGARGLLTLTLCLGTATASAMAGVSNVDRGDLAGCATAMSASAAAQGRAAMRWPERGGKRYGWRAFAAYTCLHVAAVYGRGGRVHDLLLPAVVLDLAAVAAVRLGRKEVKLD